MYRIIFCSYRFYYAEMRRKLWPKAPAKECALGHMSEKFQVYFIHINFFKYQINKIFNRAKEFYCDATILVSLFSIVYLPKKKWKLKKGSRLPTLPYIHFPLYITFLLIFACNFCVKGCNETFYSFNDMATCVVNLFPWCKLKFTESQKWPQAFIDEINY